MNHCEVCTHVGGSASAVQTGSTVQLSRGGASSVTLPPLSQSLHFFFFFFFFSSNVPPELCPHMQRRHKNSCFD